MALLEDMPHWEKGFEIERPQATPSLIYFLPSVQDVSSKHATPGKQACLMRCSLPSCWCALILLSHKPKHLPSVDCLGHKCSYHSHRKVTDVQGITKREFPGTGCIQALDALLVS